MLQKWDEKDSLDDKLYTNFYLSSDSLKPRKLDFWAQQFYPKFVENNFGKQDPPLDITAKSYRAQKYFSKEKIAHEITEIGLALSDSEKEEFTTWLKTLGYQSKIHADYTAFFKDELSINIYPAEFSQLLFIKISHNQKSTKHSDIIFSKDSKIKVDENSSVWWFAEKWK